MANTTQAKRVLIVDDEPRMASAIQRVLKNAGFETVVVETGFDVGAWLEHFIPDVITLDLQMPDINGKDVLSMIRENEQLRHIKILVVSASPMAELKPLLGKGADDVLGKPFDNAQLIDKVSRLAALSL